MKLTSDEGQQVSATLAEIADVVSQVLEKQKNVLPLSRVLEGC